MANIALDSKLTSDAVIAKVEAVFAELRSEGLEVPVQAALSSEIASMMKTMMVIMQTQQNQVEHLSTIVEQLSSDQKLGKTKKSKST